jgi:hypothetical protein
VSDLPVDLRAGATATVAAVEPESVTVLAVNQADAPGFVRLFIGCTAYPTTGMPYLPEAWGAPVHTRMSYVGASAWPQTPAASCYAVLSSASPSSAAASVLSTNFCTLPVTVVGKLSTKRM